MTISYSHALGEAWRRMGELLFRPFDLGRWFVIGFTAWLASFLDSGNSSSSIRNVLDGDDDAAYEGWRDSAVETVDQVMAEAWLMVLVGMLVVLGILLWLVLTWLGSRGQFMLLDNLVHRRSEVGRPWRELAAQGDSLFLWQIAFSIAVFFLVTVPLIVAAFWAMGMVALDAAWLTLPFFIVAGIIGFMVIVTLIYIEFFLLHVIVPIMYRYRCTASAAWGRFRAVFDRQPGHLVVFGLLHLGIAMVALAVGMAIGLATCCVGLVLFMLPYIGAVVTLPVPVFQRYLDLEFVAMLEPDWNLLDGGQPGDPEISGSGEVEGHGTVVRTEDLGSDPRDPQPGPE